MIKKILQIKLKFIARIILRRHRPKIIGISGSVGKTSTKEAISFLLSSKYSVRTSPKNYNNELGLPLTIIGRLSPGSSVWGWFKLLISAIFIGFFSRRYPEILVLEMGIDRPGDMAYLTSIAPPDIAVMTGVASSHLEFFGNLNNIQKEKQVLVEKLKPGGLAVLNYDNSGSRKMADVSSSSILNYGLQAGADLQALDLNLKKDLEKDFFGGLNCKFSYTGAVVPAYFTRIINEAGLYSVLAATAVGLRLDFNLVEIVQLLGEFSLPPGRMQVIKGINRSFIIDDTYNASPESSVLALKTLERLSTTGKKYAVLGDMLEIGSYTEEGHRLVGQQIVKSKINHLITLGEHSVLINQGAKEAGLNSDLNQHFSNLEESTQFLLKNLNEGDIVLIKGSQALRMEKIVAKVMAEPQKASKLLTRQDSEWKK